MLIHVVRPGESLWRIAQTYGIALNEIASANEVPDPERIVVGQTLVIPTKGRYYVVQPGDTLWKISRDANVPMDEIISINQIRNPAKLTVGVCCISRAARKNHDGDASLRL